MPASLKQLIQQIERKIIAASPLGRKRVTLPALGLRLATLYLGYLNFKAGGRRGSRSNPKLQVIEAFTAHKLRHTYSSMLYDAGVDPCAQKYLGHADLQVTLKIYTHLSEEKERGAVEALNRFLGDGVGADGGGGGKGAANGDVGGE